MISFCLHIFRNRNSCSQSVIYATKFSDAERNNSVLDHNLPEEDEDSSILKPKKEDMNDSVLMWNPMKTANSRNTTANFGESSFAEPPADNSCSVFGKLHTEDKRGLTRSILTLLTSCKVSNENPENGQQSGRIQIAGFGDNDFKQPRNGFNDQPHSTFNTKFRSGSAFGNSNFQSKQHRMSIGSFSWNCLVVKKNPEIL